MRRLAGTLIAAATLAATACGDLFPSSPTGPSSPDVTITASVGAYDIASHAIQFAQDGTFNATLTWSGGADLDLYLTPVDCTGYPPDACVILARSTASSGNSEKVEWQGKANEQYRIWVDNFSPTSSVSYTIVAGIR